MEQGFKLFKLLPEGSGSTINAVVKAQQAHGLQVTELALSRKKSGKMSDAEERNILANQVGAEIQQRLKRDAFFRAAWFGIRRHASRPVSVVQDKTEVLKSIGKISHQGLRIIKSSLPLEWKSESVI